MIDLVYTQCSFRNNLDEHADAWLGHNSIHGHIYRLTCLQLKASLIVTRNRLSTEMSVLVEMYNIISNLCAIK